MSQIDATARAILTWAAGVGMDPPEGGIEDADTLLALVRRHRLVGRLLYRLRALTTMPAWATPGLRTELRVRHLRTVHAQEQKIAAYREIQQTLNGMELPLAIKGWTTYALTGEPGHIRLSGDLDLLCRDPGALYETLRSLGYEGEILEDRRHEYAHLRRGPVAIEVHRYFPVYAYPPGLCAAAEGLPPKGANAAQLQCFGPPPRRDLHYNDLYEHLLYGAADGLSDLSVPGPTMAAFLLGTHEFKEYLTSPLDLPIPVRLGVLADIRDLARHPAFCPERFMRLVTRFGAEDAVSLVNHLLIRWLNYSLPVPGAGERDAPLFPRQLGFRGVWANLYPAEDGILPPHRAILFERIFQGSSASAPTAIQHIVRPLWQDKQTVGRVFAVRSAQDVTMTVTLPARSERTARFRIRVDWLGDQANAGAVELDQNDVRISGPVAAHREQESGTSRICLRVERKWFDSVAWERSDLRLLLTLMILMPEGADFFDAAYVTAIPLRAAQSCRKL